MTVPRLKIKNNIKYLIQTKQVINFEIKKNTSRFRINKHEFVV